MVLGSGGFAKILMNELPRTGIAVSLKYLSVWTLCAIHAMVLLPPFFFPSACFEAQVPWAPGIQHCWVLCYLLPLGPCFGLTKGIPAPLQCRRWRPCLDDFMLSPACVRMLLLQCLCCGIPTSLWLRRGQRSFGACKYDGHCSLGSRSMHEGKGRWVCWVGFRKAWEPGFLCKGKAWSHQLGVSVLLGSPRHPKLAT